MRQKGGFAREGEARAGWVYIGKGREGGQQEDMEGTGVGGVQRAGLREGSSVRPCRPGCGRREALDSRQQEVQPRAHSPAGLGLEGKEGLVPQHQLLFPTLGNSSFTPHAHPHPNPAANWALAPLRCPSPRKLALAAPRGSTLPSQSSYSPSAVPPGRGCQPRARLPSPRLGVHQALGSRAQTDLARGPQEPCPLTALQAELRPQLCLWEEP